MKRIPLTQNKFALVDDEDYKSLSIFNWFVISMRSGYPYASRNRYVRNNGKKINHPILMHREIMNPPRNKVVDHINHNTLDNRRCNLRVCSMNENASNRLKAN